MKKILFITWTRAEYWILEPLILKFKNDRDFDVKLLATWMHTLEKYWKTIEYIKWRCNVDYTVSISEKWTQLSWLWEEIIWIENAIRWESFDYIFVLWDRDEAFAWAIVWSHLNIPVAHIHWWDTTWHIPDEYIRNSITKMSLLHFVACKQHYEKVKSMWENDKLIFDVWALCFDWIEWIDLFDRQYLTQNLWLDLNKKWILTVVHPSITDCNKYSFDDQASIFDYLPNNTENIVIYPNSDTWTDVFVKKIESLKWNNFHCIKNLDRKVYLSLFKSVNLMIWNSSSWIVESESFTTPTINIWNRQKWRLHSKRVFDVSYDKNEVTNLINHLLENENVIRSTKIERVYYKNDVSWNIVNVIKTINPTEIFSFKFL